MSGYRTLKKVSCYFRDFILCTQSLSLGVVGLLYNCEATPLQSGTLSSTSFKKKLQNFHRLARKSQNVNSDNIPVGRRRKGIMSLKIKLPVHFAPPAFLCLLSPIKYLKQMCNKTLDNDFFQSHFVMYFFKVSVTRSSTI